jgi:hypothetical protein
MLRLLLMSCAVCLVVLPVPRSFTRAVQQGAGEGEGPMALSPLIEWEWPDVLAEQLPAPTTPPVPPPAASPAPPPAAAEPPAADPATPPEEPQVEDDFSLGDIPVVETIELDPVKAKTALDTYVMVREKYKDAALENFENLQDFVDQSPQGKAFEADVKAAGFKDVTEWNTTITTLSFAHDNMVVDQTADIKQQITELQADTSMAQDMRDRMISALNAMIPSDNNRKVVEDLMKDPAAAEKLKLLDTEAE